MGRTAIDDPWRPDDDPGRRPEPLDQWLAAGFAVEEAEIWRNWRFRLQSAEAWRGAGVLDGLQAAQWSAAGVTANAVGQWRSAGITAREAVTWREFGFGLEEARRNKAKGVTPAEAYSAVKPPPPLVGMRPNPAPRAAPRPFPFVPGPRMAGAMQQFMQSGVPPHLLNGYFQCQWTDDDAVSWAKEGIEAPDAKLWKAMGVRPGEAGRLTREGATVVETSVEWWRAAIPVDEVADWIGAGLSAPEAAEQRARGVTAEQAAAVGALRDEPLPLDTPFESRPMSQPRRPTSVGVSSTWTSLQNAPAAALVETAKAGDKNSWTELVSRFGGMIAATGRRYRLAPAQVAELERTTWSRLAQNLDRIDQPERVGGWLATTARREALEILRRAGGGMLASGATAASAGAGPSPIPVHSYAMHGWGHEEPMAWAREGIDVRDAELWKAMGVRPTEAGRLAQDGSSAAETVLEWWRAAIPVDEVGDWVGAGLSAAEAAEQRARGVTAEQAAALRALRDEPVPRDTPVPPTPMSQPLSTVRAVLTRREVEVLQMLANGASSSDVAKKLLISAKTVKNHLAHIYSKLGATNRGQTVAKAVRLGIVRID